MGDAIYVYVMTTPGMTDVVSKVGISRVPLRRLDQIRRALKREIYLADTRLETSGRALAVERYAHWLLREYHIRGEWFRVDDGAAWTAVREAQYAIDRGEVAPFRIAGPGRPRLVPTEATVPTMVRLLVEDRERIKALVGPNGMAAFIREAIERKLAALEARSPNPQPKDREGER